VAGLRPDALGELSTIPRTPSCLQGVYFYGEERKGRERKGRENRGGEGQGKEGVEGNRVEGVVGE